MVHDRERRDGGQQDTAYQVGGHQHRPAAGAVDEHAREDADQQVRQPARRTDQADLRRAAAALAKARAA